MNYTESVGSLHLGFLKIPNYSQYTLTEEDEKPLRKFKSFEDVHGYDSNEQKTTPIKIYLTTETPTGKTLESEKKDDNFVQPFLHKYFKEEKKETKVVSHEEEEKEVSYEEEKKEVSHEEGDESNKSD